MLLKTINILFLLGCSIFAKSQERWGILSFSSGRPVVYSMIELNKLSKYRIYKMPSMEEHKDISIIKAISRSKSPLYDSNGANRSWEHQISGSNMVPSGSIWLCLPVEWEFTVTGNDGGTIKTSIGLKGTVGILKRAEGIEITLDINDKREKLYYYLNYDI